jgi:serine/threonine protein kinase
VSGAGAAELAAYEADVLRAIAAEGAQIPDLFGQESSYLVLSPVGTRITTKLQFSVQVFRQVLVEVQRVHGLGYSHRDLRPSNVLLAPTPTGVTGVLLNDWNAAAVIGRDTAFAGSLHYASSRALAAAAQGSDYPPQAADDLESLLRLVIIYRAADCKPLLKLDTAPQIEEWWSVRLDAFKDSAEMLKACQALEYEQLRSLVERVFFSF